ncbi:hypothetical protein ZIOFF_073260 [Zingiber officinale]|uniref:Uncharacterized protein n=1 Tax=Zingiber officinale TaxID=94328 RepID=A0A8J5C912_ZINOF|nr:hypothetical protein ZIOFF_073260 [Zingiber officinale]
MPPGRGGRDGPADEFMWIHAAYETLSDPDKRTEYDRGDMEAVRMVAIMSKNMEAVRMSERMSFNSGFTIMYSSSIYLCFGCELNLASTAQLIFRFTRSSSIISLMRNSIGHMECEDFGSVLGILIQGKLCVEFWLYFYEYLEDMQLYRIMLEIL